VAIRPTLIKNHIRVQPYETWTDQEFIEDNDVWSIGNRQNTVVPDLLKSVYVKCCRLHHKSLRLCNLSKRLHGYRPVFFSHAAKFLNEVVLARRLPPVRLEPPTDACGPTGSRVVLAYWWENSKISHCGNLFLAVSGGVRWSQKAFQGPRRSEP
jgi:hypothetical protein